MDVGVALLKSVTEPLRTEQLNIMLVSTLRACAEGLARLGEFQEAERTIAVFLVDVHHHSLFCDNCVRNI